jgi:nucleotide-binding universal stress UspA family protein
VTTAVRTILTGVDESSNAQQALRWAVTIAERFEAEVVAVHAVGLLARIGDGPPVPSQQHLDQLLSAFETDWSAFLDAAPVRSRRLFLDGPAVEVLLRVVEEVGGDLLVVGRKGSGGGAELVLGSVSHQLAERAPCPVLIIPAAAPS